MIKRNVITIGDEAFEFDQYDADDKAALVKAADAMNAKFEAVSGTGASLTPDEIRTLCNIVFDFLDDVLGDGAHKRIFGERANLISAFEVLSEFTDHLHESDKERLEKAVGRSRKYGIGRIAKRK